MNYSNRATAYIKLLAYPEALKDLDKCLEIKPDFGNIHCFFFNQLLIVKAYIKKGSVHFQMKEYQKCLKVYEAALEYEPNNAEIAAAIQKTMYAINTNQDEESVRQNVARDPEIQAILVDPVMRQVLQDLKTDPTSFAKYMADPRIKANLDKLIASGVIRTG